MATIRDVANLAHVSPATVSVVLNGSASNLRISTGTRLRVESAAVELGYRANSYARALRTNRSSTIGILAFDIVDPYCAHVMRGAESVIAENRYYPVFADLQNDASRLDRYIDFFRAKRIEGLLILASSIQVENTVIEHLVGEGLPLVIIGREVANFEVPTVVTDSRGGAFQATQHLLDLGHRDIAFILGPTSYTDSCLRRLGAQQAMERAGLTFRSDLVVEESTVGWGPEAGYKATKRLLKCCRGTFTAVFAFDDISAFGVIRALTEADLKVPGDVSVVGFDDIPAAAFYNPPLTTVHYSMVGMGRQSAEMLFKLIGGNLDQTRTSRVVARSRLVQRGSTKQFVQASSPRQ